MRGIAHLSWGRSDGSAEVGAGHEARGAAPDARDVPLRGLAEVRRGRVASTRHGDTLARLLRLGITLRRRLTGWTGNGCAPRTSVRRVSLHAPVFRPKLNFDLASARLRDAAGRLAKN